MNTGLVETRLGEIISVLDRMLYYRVLRPKRGIGHNVADVRGHGTDFLEYTGYAKGDDVRRIDWKLYGKKEAFFVKRMTSEFSSKNFIFTDISDSISLHGKTELAVLVTLALGHVVLHNKNDLSLTLFGDSPVSIPVRMRDVASLWATLSTVTTSGRADLESALIESGVRRTSDADIWIVTDCISFDPAELERTFAHLAALGSRTTLIHLTPPGEHVFAHAGEIVALDAESGRDFEFEANEQFRARYARSMNETTARIAALAAAGGVRYRRIESDLGIEAMVIELFSQQAPVLGARR